MYAHLSELSEQRVTLCSVMSAVPVPTHPVRRVKVPRETIGAGDGVEPSSVSPLDEPADSNCGNTEPFPAYCSSFLAVRKIEF